MSKIVEELLEEFPELKGNFKALEELVNATQKYKGNIKVSPIFKMRLKERIENVIALETGKQKTRSWVYFLVPSFTFCLVLFGVFAVYKDISFFNKNNDNFVPVTQSTMLTEGDVGVNNYLPENVDNSSVMGEEIKEDVLIIPAAGVMGADIDLRNFSDFDLDLGGDFTQVVDTVEPMNTKIENEALDISAMLNEIFGSTSLQTQVEIVDFEEYCLGNSGEILETTEGRACIMRGGGCLEKNFTGVCNYIP